MTKIDDYLHAATRDNIRRSYQAAARHFEVEWGGFLPATADAFARYLVDHADSLAINTLRQRLAALAQWHIEQGFPDPTKARKCAKPCAAFRHCIPRGKSAHGRCRSSNSDWWLNGSTDRSPRHQLRETGRHIQKPPALIYYGGEVRRRVFGSQFAQRHMITMNRK